ncbi:MAG TPA: hypothetical protein VHR66_32950 [Gemmataceae bacterium]|nr:hypothetical protein [Gemmataceae bacterium]
MADNASDLPTILDAIRHELDVEGHWFAFASWLWDNGRDDEAAVVRVFWPVIRDELPGRTLEAALELVRRESRLLGQRAREAEVEREESSRQTYH